MRLKTIFIPFPPETKVTDSGDGSQIVATHPGTNDDTANARQEILDAIADGFSVISSTPVNSTINLIRSSGGDNVISTYTSGIYFFLLKEDL